MANHPPVRAVCFDLGGVVVRIADSWAHGCQIAGLDVREVPADPTRLAEAQRVNERYQRGDVDLAHLAESWSGLMDGVYTAGEVRAVILAWLLGEYDGIAALLGRVARSVTTVVLSNTCPEHWAIISDYPSMQHIDHPFASHELALTKPGAEIFRAVEAQLGIAGDEILFFDDTPRNVDGARAVGWRAELIDPHSETAPQMQRHLERAGLL